jgi:predicted RNA-binding protein with PIN domain
MRYLIDGYNLLHAVEVRTKHDGPHSLEPARNRLLDRLRRGHGADAVNLTIVFDASRPPPGVSNRQNFHGITVLFAVGEQADDTIEQLIHHDAAPKQLTVVSNDRRLQEAARRRECRVLDCISYLEHLQHPEPPRAVAESDAFVKPDHISGEETRQWMETFGDVDKDPGLRDWFEMNPPPEESE